MGKKPVVIASVSLVFVVSMAVWFGAMRPHRLRTDVIFDPGQRDGKAPSREGRAQSVVRRVHPEQTEGLESRTPEPPSLEPRSPGLAGAGVAGPSLEALVQRARNM